MDETLVQAGWARSRIWAAQETPTLYGTSVPVPVLQYRYLYSSTGTYSTGTAVLVLAAGAVGCVSCFYPTLVFIVYSILYYTNFAYYKLPVLNLVP